MDVSIIIVNHRSEKYLPDCISSIDNAFHDVCYEIIVVNNDSTPIKTHLPAKNLRVIDNRTDHSFGKANNLGAKHAQAPILWFLNPDTKILSADFAQLKILLDDEAIGGVGMKLVDKNKFAQKWSAGYEITPFGIILSNLGFNRSKKIWDSNQILEVAWVSGCAFAIRRDFFTTITGFDENFFMYFEDVDICKRIRQLKKKILFYPGIKVLHFGGKSYSQKSTQKKHYYTSQRLYLQKYFGSFRSTCIHFIRLLFSA